MVLSNESKTKSMQALKANSYLSGGNAGYLEELYEQFLKDPSSVSNEWQDYFRSLPKVNGLSGFDVSHADIRQQFAQLARQTQKVVSVSGDALEATKQFAVDELINAYRTYGHLAAKLNPLLDSSHKIPELELSYYGLNSSDYEKKFYAPTFFGQNKTSLKEICQALQETYTRTIGAEYTYILDNEEVKWLKNRLESTRARAQLSAEEKRALLKLLVATDGLEKYLGTKYVGQTRFSLEGGDSFIPFVNEVAQSSALKDVKEIVIGMAHRGRLNVLVNIMGQPTAELYQEFEGKKNYGMTSGDVKYHLGISSDINTIGGPLHLSLAFNPSHLEIISPVIMGSVRARQDKHTQDRRSDIMALVVHGDASFSGQGIVMETLNMSQTRAYDIEGSVHIVINNQVGFTTDPSDSRSSRYCTDVAKMIEAPVFHVNGDDPEAVIFLAKLAVDYRMRFKKDIVIDLICYRRFGHNEGDEPAATQPMMYHIIRNHPSPREIYAKQLIAEGVCTQEEVDKMAENYRDALDAGKRVVDVLPDGLARQYSANWAPYLDKEWNIAVDTSIDKKRLVEIAKRMETLPTDFELQRQVGNLMATRVKMSEGEQPLDWGYAETMAYATLLLEGFSVRMSGQDVERGTFAHRHIVLHDQKTGRSYIPLQHLSTDQAPLHLYNSLLSEAGAMGFEYGYATTDPKSLVIWEAQYGDFANGAQVVIDQFISSGWQKWKTLCGLVLLLPHGYEGKGPEHSSARLERYLQLCAQDNMQVCIPSTPAQVFHMLRRQVIRPYRTPLIVMTPKSMLRNKLAVSSLEDLVKGHFQLVIPEIDDISAAKVKRVILCSGKLYYEILSKRRELKLEDIAIVRLEQLYPFPYDELKAELSRYTKATEVVWAQEEPQNQGAWYIIRHRIEDCLMSTQKLSYAGRPDSASPAAGYMALHTKQQTQLIDDALAISSKK